MQKSILYYIFIFFCAPLVSLGQITLESTDMTVIGDEILRYVDTIPVYGPGNAGANQTWDFSNAQNDTLNNTSVVTVASTPYSSTFGSSDYSMTNDNLSFLYFNHNAGIMNTTGAAGDLLGTGEIIEAPFTDYLTLHQFPRTFMSTFDDTYAFEAEADGAAFNVHRIRLDHSGHVFDTTDAYGTLITPTGTYQALRVKSVDFTTDVIEVQLSEFIPIWTNFATVVDTSVSYSWHAKEEMLAIAEMSFDSIGNPSRFVYSTVAPVSSVGIVNEKSQADISLYPQPAQNEFFVNGLNLAANYYAEIYSMDGRLVKRERLFSNRISTSELPCGVYLLRLESQNGEARQQLKLVVRR